MYVREKERTLIAKLWLSMLSGKSELSVYTFIKLSYNPHNFFISKLRCTPILHSFFLNSSFDSKFISLINSLTLYNVILLKHSNIKTDHSVLE